MCVSGPFFVYIYVLFFLFHFLFCIVSFGWPLIFSTLTALLNPPPTAHKPSLLLLLSTSSSCTPAFNPPLLFLSSPLSPLPLLSSFVDEIRWFLLGEASVHPSAAPSRTCPTPSNQVINKPANSHSPSISCCLFSTSAVLYVRPCPHAAPCELTASPTHWWAHLTLPFIFQKNSYRVFWTEVLMALKGTPPCWKSDNKTRFNCELSS